MADPKFDPAVHAQNSQQLNALATQARAALPRRHRRAHEPARPTSATTQLRDAHGAEQEAAAANQQVSRELAAAEKFDKEAAALERKAAVLERNAKSERDRRGRGRRST